MTYSGARSLLSMGVSRPTLYEVTLPDVGSGINDYLRFFCKATFIPEVSVARVAAVSHDAIGVTRQQAYRVDYGKPFEITIIENSDFEIYKSIREWFDQNATNINRNSGGSGPNRSQRMAYYSEIVKDMTLKKLENPKDTGREGPGPGANDLRTVLEVTFQNAYPVRVGSITLASDAFDSAVEFTAAFTYETYSYD